MASGSERMKPFGRNVLVKSADPSIRTDLLNSRAHNLSEIRRIAACQFKRGREAHVLLQHGEGIDDIILGPITPRDQLQVSKAVWHSRHLISRSDAFFFQNPQEAAEE